MKKLLRFLVVFSFIMLLSIPAFCEVQPDQPMLLVRWVASMGSAFTMYYITGIWWVMFIY